MVEDGAQGFGEVINIVNGGIECNHELPPFDDDYGKKFDIELTIFIILPNTWV
jgi:hypothetical protein